MRHSRRRVMKEHYKLYMKKHITNGRYFARNMQIVMCVVLVIALTIGCVAIGTSGKLTDEANNEVSVKEALFGSNESNTKSTKRNTEENVDNNVDNNTEEVVVASIDTEFATTQDMTTGEEVEMVVEATEEETEPSLFDDRCIANVEDTLNIRKEPNSESDFVGSMEPGAIAVVEGIEGEWTKIKSGDVEGYVLSQYILTGSVAEAFAKDYVILHGTVLEDGVNIRAEKSTSADIVTILDKDAVVTVLDDPTKEEDVSEHVAEDVVEDVVSTEDAVEDSGLAETTEENNEEDDILWMTVRLEDGQEGYVSAEYITVDELYQVAVSKEELERKAAEEEAARKAAEEEAAKKAAEAMASTKPSANKGNISGGNSSYQGSTVPPITAAEAGESLGTFTITAYCGCTKCSGGSNLTATGTVPAQGRTIAADPSVLPYGTKVVIGGIVYTVEDCGSGVRGNHIDIFFATHEQALAFGRRSMQVFKY